jgi:exosortase F-associated protein
MFKNIILNKKKLLYVVVLVALLVLIRVFEDKIFYDPFINYFKQEFTNLPFPEINPIKLFLSFGFRFYLNTLLSLFLLYVIFETTKIVKFSILLYMVFGSLLMISFFFVYTFFAEESKMTLFYIRRFIIQPILVLLFIPAFYYQNKISKN